MQRSCRRPLLQRIQRTWTSTSTLTRSRGRERVSFRAVRRRPLRLWAQMSVIGIAAHQARPGQGLLRSLDCRLMRNAARHLSLARGWNVPLRRPSDIPAIVPGFRGFSAPPKRSHDRGVIVIQDDRHALADIGGTTICLRVWAWALRCEAGIPGENPSSSASGVNCDRMVLI